MFKYSVTIKMHDTDAAGLLFFSQQFKLMHDAYEAVLEKIGFSFATLLKKKSYFLPIVHAESDYKKTLFVGDRLTIEVTVENIGRHSFTMAYRLVNDKKELVGSGKTVHVTMDKEVQAKIPIPEDLLMALENVGDNP